MVMTRVPCAFSIALIACARRMANHLPISKGCSAMSTTIMKKIVEKSKDMVFASVGNGCKRARSDSDAPAGPQEDSLTPRGGS
jgi:hypothetical protein